MTTTRRIERSRADGIDIRAFAGVVDPSTEPTTGVDS